MARLLVGDTWYEKVSPTSFFEFEYADLVASRAPLIFPDHYVVPFKKTVESEDGRATPDLALIERNYRKWWVVEIELSHHSLSGHVLPQIRNLSNANYGPDIAQYLSEQSGSLDSTSVEAMMRGSQPKVLVVVNEQVPDWVRMLSPHGALVAVVEVFRSDRNRHVFRLNGDFPEVPGDEVSILRSDPHMSRLMIVESPGGLEPTATGHLLIEFEGAVTEWTMVAAKDRVWLSPLRANPLAPGQRYILLKGEDGRLKVQEAR